MAKTESELLQRVAQGQNEAFAELFDLHASSLLGYLTRLLGQRSLAEDVSQEVWMKIIRAAGQYKDTGHFRAWMFTIARNTAFNHLRSAETPSVSLDSDEVKKIEDMDTKPLDELLEQKESHAKLKVAIDELPENQRVALVLYAGEDLSYEQIAQTMKTTVTAVKSLIFRARQGLEKLKGGRI